MRGAEDQRRGKSPRGVLLLRGLLSLENLLRRRLSSPMRFFGVGGCIEGGSFFSARTFSTLGVSFGGDVNERNNPDLEGLAFLRILGMGILSLPAGSVFLGIVDATRVDFTRGLPPGYGAKVLIGME